MSAGDLLGLLNECRRREAEAATEVRFRRERNPMLQKVAGPELLEAMLQNAEDEHQLWQHRLNQLEGSLVDAIDEFLDAVESGKVDYGWWVDDDCRYPPGGFS